VRVVAVNSSKKADSANKKKNNVSKQNTNDKINSSHKKNNQVKNNNISSKNKSEKIDKIIKEKEVNKLDVVKNDDKNIKNDSKKKKVTDKVDNKIVTNKKIEIKEKKVEENLVSDKKKQASGNKDQKKEITNKDEMILDSKKEDIALDNKKSNKFKKKYLFLIVYLLVIFALWYIAIPKINLNGDDKLIISYDEEYVEAGYEAKFLGRDITSDVLIDNELEIGKIGNYKISYYIKYLFFTIKKERYVSIIDSKEPVINIKSDVINICPNQKLPKLEYSVIDEYDGDITLNTKENILDDKITLSVSDSSNNVSNKIIKIDRSDRDKPEISLKGNSTIYLNLSEKYVEPGYSAKDNCDGDITSKVSVSGSVGKSSGNYKINYSVTDSGGNKSMVTRTVIVINKNAFNEGNIINGSIYLTFDDGPNVGTTNVILDILKKEGVKATFFVTCNGADSLIKRIYDEGHTIALHTATHNYSYLYSSTDNYFNDLKTVSNRVKRITGIDSKIIRFPGGSSNTISRNYKKGIMTELSNMVINEGYRYYDWNIDSMDASTARNSQDVYNNVISNLSRNGVNMVLMHDTRTITRDALRNIIRYGKSQGYSFKKIEMDTYMVRHGINN